jgi:hypothetical protein
MYLKLVISQKTCFLLGSRNPLIRIRNAYGSKDPDPSQNVRDPELIYVRKITDTRYICKLQILVTFENISKKPAVMIRNNLWDPESALGPPAAIF